MLKGEKIILRPIRFDDWEHTVKWRNDLFIKSSTMSHPFPITDELEKEWYEHHLKSKNNNYLPFTVVSRESGIVLGYFSLNCINWISRNAFVSGAIGETENVGKGLGREAVELLLRYAFDHLNLTKVCAYVRTDHRAMKSWVDIGAVTEGILKEHFYSDGAFHDVALLAWFSHKKKQS